MLDDTYFFLYNGDKVTIEMAVVFCTTRRSRSSI
nr:MAG TPA: hypothetical protein [Caudoviricetes sp.]